MPMPPRTNSIAGLILLPLLVASAGCTYTVHPLLKKQDLTGDVDLSGRWKMELTGSETQVAAGQGDGRGQKQQIPLTLEKHDRSTYDVYLDEQFQKEVGKGNWPEAWTLQIGKVGNETYGQLIPRESRPGPPLFSGVPVYYLMRIELSDDTREVRFHPMLDNASDALAEYEKLPHITHEPSVFVRLTVFTGNSSDLQKMVTEHGKTLFSPRPVVLRRDDKASPDR